VDGVHWQQLLKARWLATDGTGLKVLVLQLETAHNGYLELYRNDSLACSSTSPAKPVKICSPSCDRSKAHSRPTPSTASMTCISMAA
jgi:hypothetical protein